MIPDAAIMRQLRATLVEGRAAPAFQRLLIERQVQHGRKTVTPADGTAAAKLSMENVQEASFSATEASIQDARKTSTGLAVGSATRPRNSCSPCPYAAHFAEDVILEGTEGEDTTDDFWTWLSNAVLQQLPYFNCLVGGAPEDQGSADATRDAGSTGFLSS